MMYGSSPRSARAQTRESPLEPTTQAPVLLFNYMAASKWMLRPLLLVRPTFLGGASTRGLALKHLAMSTTTAAVDACVWGN